VSTIVSAACWPIQMPPTQKSVLMSLADNANDHGVCWPALETIQMRTCLARSTVIEAIKWLEAHGLLAAERQPGKSTRYQVIPNGLAPSLFDGKGNPSSYRTGPKGRPVQQVDGYERRTGPAAGPNPSGSRTQPVQQPDPNRKEPSKAGISPGAHEPGDRVGQFEGHATPRAAAAAPTAAGAIARELRAAGFRINAQSPDLLAAVAEGVTLEHIAELAQVYPATHAKCRGSPGYLLAAARRQRAENVEPATPVSRGTHATSTRSGQSAVDRAAARARDILERTGGGA
jgi:hypothetical protein